MSQRQIGDVLIWINKRKPPQPGFAGREKLNLREVELNLGLSLSWNNAPEPVVSLGLDVCRFPRR